MKNLLGIGECMVELSSAGADDLMRLSFAGDVLNTLWYAQKAFATSANQWAAGFLSAVGTDPMSEQMLGFLRSANMNTDGVRRIAERRPGLYMIHLDGAERSFSYWRDNSAARLLADDVDFLNKQAVHADALYFSGITLAILTDPDRAVLLDMLDNANKEGKLVAFDPNIRPALWSDASRMRDAITQAAGCANLILPSFDDEAAHFGDADLEETAKRYQSTGAPLVVVKNGPGDILIADNDERHLLDTPPVDKPVDTTGAGDSFNGAFLADYVVHQDVQSAVRAAQKCSSQVICHYGALIPMES